MHKFGVGDKVFIIENSIFVKEVVITKYVAGFYTVKRLNGQTAYRVRESRLYATENEAANNIKNRRLNL